MPDILHKSFPGEVKNWNDQELVIEHFISTETQDSGGDIMLADGMKVRGIPVVLFQHGMDPKFGSEPIAKALDIRIGEHNGKRGIIAKTKYFDGSTLTPPDNTGRRLYEKAKDGTMPNWSIGYNAIKSKPCAGGRVVSEWELHEYSQVAVGMNAEACTLAEKVPELKFFIKADDPAPDPAPDPALDAAKAAEDLAAQAAADELAASQAVIDEKAFSTSYKRAHKALLALHKELMRDLKEQGEREDFIDAGASACAKAAMEDFADCATPHAEKYIKAVRDMGEGDCFGDEDDDEANPIAGAEEKGGPGSGRYPAGSGKNPRAEGGRGAAEASDVSTARAIGASDRANEATIRANASALNSTGGKREHEAAMREHTVAQTAHEDAAADAQDPDMRAAHESQAEQHRISAAAHSQALQDIAMGHSPRHIYARRKANDTKGYRGSHNALRKSLAETVKAIRAFKGNKSVVPAQAADELMKAHLDSATPHAVEFVKAWHAKMCSDEALVAQETKPVLKITETAGAESDTAGKAAEAVKVKILQPPVQVLKVVTPQPEPQPIIRLAEKAVEQPKLKITPELVKELISSAQAGMQEMIAAEIRKTAGKVTK